MAGYDTAAYGGYDAQQQGYGQQGYGQEGYAPQAGGYDQTGYPQPAGYGGESFLPHAAGYSNEAPPEGYGNAAYGQEPHEPDQYDQSGRQPGFEPHEPERRGSLEDSRQDERAGKEKRDDDRRDDRLEGRRPEDDRVGKDDDNEPRHDRDEDDRRDEDGRSRRDDDPSSRKDNLHDGSCEQWHLIGDLVARLSHAEDREAIFAITMFALEHCCGQHREPEFTKTARRFRMLGEAAEAGGDESAKRVGRGKGRDGGDLEDGPRDEHLKTTVYTEVARAVAEEERKERDLLEMLLEDAERDAVRYWDVDSHVLPRHKHTARPRSRAGDRDEAPRADDRRDKARRPDEPSSARRPESRLGAERRDEPAAAGRPVSRPPSRLAGDRRPVARLAAARQEEDRPFAAAAAANAAPSPFYDPGPQGFAAQY